MVPRYKTTPKGLKVHCWNIEKGFKDHKDENPLGDFMGVIEVEVPEGIPLKPLKTPQGSFYKIVTALQCVFMDIAVNALC